MLYFFLKRSMGKKAVRHMKKVSVINRIIKKREKNDEIRTWMAQP